MSPQHQLHTNLRYPLTSDCFMTVQSTVTVMFVLYLYFQITGNKKYMEYSLRCNRFRDYAQRSQLPQCREVRDRLASPAFQAVRMLPPHQSAIIAADLRNQAPYFQPFFQTPTSKRKIFDPQSDKVTNRTQATYSSDFKNAQNRRVYSQHKHNSSFTLSQTTPNKKRKTHFLTVVSRLPGMSKSKPKNCI